MAETPQEKLARWDKIHGYLGKIAGDPSKHQEWENTVAKLREEQGKLERVFDRLIDQCEARTKEGNRQRCKNAGIGVDLEGRLPGVGKLCEEAVDNAVRRLSSDWRYPISTSKEGMLVRGPKDKFYRHYLQDTADEEGYWAYSLFGLQPPADVKIPFRGPMLAGLAENVGRHTVDHGAPAALRLEAARKTSKAVVAALGELDGCMNRAWVSRRDTGRRRWTR